MTTAGAGGGFLRISWIGDRGPPGGTPDGSSSPGRGCHELLVSITVGFATGRPQACDAVARESQTSSGAQPECQ